VQVPEAPLGPCVSTRRRGGSKAALQTVAELTGPPSSPRCSLSASASVMATDTVTLGRHKKKHRQTHHTAPSSPCRMDSPH
jgi:hypothetical protein